MERSRRPGRRESSERVGRRGRGGERTKSSRVPPRLVPNPSARPSSTSTNAVVFQSCSQDLQKTHPSKREARAEETSRNLSRSPSLFFTSSYIMSLNQSPASYKRPNLLACLCDK